ncbi:MAG TPA: hypothetical protein VM054_00815 [bacterium]|nr:hypothetical protein [bacterium]
MKKFLILAVVLLMMAPAAFGKNMVEGKFGAGLSLGTGTSMLYPGNALGLGINLQYGITGLTFQGVFNYALGISPATGDLGDASESFMDFGVNFLGTVGDGPFVGYAGLGFFYLMRSVDWGIGDPVDTSTYGLNLTSAVDYFLSDMIALGFQIGYPISLGSDDGNDATDDDGAANITGSSYKVTLKFFF